MPLVAEVRAAVPRHQLSPLVVVAPLCWVQEPAALSFAGAVVAARVFPVAVRAVAVVVAVVVVAALVVGIVAGAIGAGAGAAGGGGEIGNWTDSCDSGWWRCFWSCC